MPTGIVTQFSSKKQFGKIKVDEGGERIVHSHDLLSWSSPLQEGLRVEFEDGADGQHVTNVFVLVEFEDPSADEVQAVESQTEDVRPAEQKVEEAPVLKGTVKSFDHLNGRGVIIPDGDGRNVYVSYRNLRVNALEEGQRVEFSLVNGRMGPQAKRVRVIQESGADEVQVVESAPESNVLRVARFGKKRVQQSKQKHCKPKTRGVLKVGNSYNGTVKCFDKGFGFITVHGADEDVFVHQSDIMGTGVRMLTEGDEVNFVVKQGRKGLQAGDVKVEPQVYCSSTSI